MIDLILVTFNTNVLSVGNMKSYKVVIVSQIFSFWIYSVLSFHFKMKYISFVSDIFFPVYNLLTHQTTTVLP